RSKGVQSNWCHAHDSHRAGDGHFRRYADRTGAAVGCAYLHIEISAADGAACDGYLWRLLKRPFRDGESAASDDSTAGYTVRGGLRRFLTRRRDAAKSQGAVETEAEDCARRRGRAFCGSHELPRKGASDADVSWAGARGQEIRQESASGYGRVVRERADAKT